MTRRPLHIVGGVAAVLVSAVVFLVPFAFIIIQALKDVRESSDRSFALPTTWHLWDNLTEVLSTRDYMLVTAFINSIILTVAGVGLLVVFGAMVGFVLQRRPSRWTNVINFFVLAGLIIPPAVVPTIWVLQGLGLFKTLHGLILIEVAYGLSFAVLLFRSFIATVPRELDEAAIIDGAGPFRLFFTIVLPLLFWYRSIPMNGARLNTLSRAQLAGSCFLLLGFQSQSWRIGGSATFSSAPSAFSTSWKCE